MPELTDRACRRPRPQRGRNTCAAIRSPVHRVVGRSASSAPARSRVPWAGDIGVPGPGRGGGGDRPRATGSRQPRRIGCSAEAVRNPRRPRPPRSATGRIARLGARSAARWRRRSAKTGEVPAGGQDRRPARRPTEFPAVRRDHLAPRLDVSRPSATTRSCWTRGSLDNDHPRRHGSWGSERDEGDERPRPGG